MRIIAGEFRGRTLKSLKGDTTRPTTDRVREALMSAIVSARGSFEDARILDAFAGSGALGFEALSRGAAYALFCEQNREAQRIIEANASTLKLDRGCYRLRKGDSFGLSGAAERPFDVVFLDPPYAYEAQRIVQLVAELDTAGMLAEGALICYEHAKKDKQDAANAFDALKYTLVFVKDYGDTSIIALRKDSK